MCLHANVTRSLKTFYRKTNYIVKKRSDEDETKNTK